MQRRCLSHFGSGVLDSEYVAIAVESVEMGGGGGG